MNKYYYVSGTEVRIGEIKDEQDNFWAKGALTIQ